MARIFKISKMITHMICLLLISYFFTQKCIDLALKKKLIRHISDIKYLLIWTRLPGITSSGQKHFIEANCAAYNCYFTTNRSLFGDLRYFDGIVFNLQDVSGRNRDLPWLRGWYQKYIFAANDSADNYPVCEPVYDNFFNWTWTYKTDSTISYSFISVYTLENEDLGGHHSWAEMKLISGKVKAELSSKSKAAAIFLDQCESRSKRETFLKELQKHLSKYNLTVDVFGKCGTMECRRKSMKPCLWKLKKFYFFYLALEDSFAEDFVTKTVLYGYQNNVVPVVYGKADYERILPPNSYLDGLSLGPEKLASVMFENTINPLRYQKFFKWKNNYKVRESKVLDACTLCSALNNRNWLTHQVVYPEFRKWWNPEFEKRCNEGKYFLF